MQKLILDVILVFIDNFYSFSITVQDLERSINAFSLSNPIIKILFQKRCEFDYIVLCNGSNAAQAQLTVVLKDCPRVYSFEGMAYH